MTGPQKAAVCLVGAGRRGGALLRGWLAAGFPAGALAIREPHPSAEIAALLKEKGIPGEPQSTPDVLVLAVKPQIMNQVLSEAAPFAGAATAVLSIAAGRTVASIASHFPAGTAIVRAMPNLPAEVGRGITAAYANAHVTRRQRDLCDALLRAAGGVAWIEDESFIDAVTAVSGSGPAYVFYLAECLAEAAISAGLPQDLAMELARATVTGAGELLFRSPLSPAELRENVTSPGGTTAAGLSILMREPGLKDLIRETVAAAARRSRELSS
ncbi:MAG: pyrroline-5-carboxylate reductase [Rhodomicrobium sp.]|nr:pyrroline-5-carboxylate reductase [Rhodomicrobium sp.]